jgi:Xaa-Pro aminopeptidase/Xaa-Pro dipeptidase
MNNNSNIMRRLSILRETLRGKNLSGAFFTGYENRRYYSGFTGSAGYLIVTLDDAILITDKRYTEQARQQTQGIRVYEHGAGRQKRAAEEIRRMGLQSIAFEDTTEVGEYFAIMGEIPEVQAKLEGECFLEQRMVKDDEEIALIREAIGCSDRAFAGLIPRLKAGMSEKDLADELHYLANREGAEALSFGTIVAAGTHGAMAHWAPSAYKIQSGEMVIVDFGVMKNGYVSDMTRTLFFGEVPEEQYAVFNLVRRSMEAAFAAIAPGTEAKTVEEAHRQIFRDAGMEEHALKGLGHGVGLQIHESPRVVIGSETVLREGMVFTVEPGLYIPGSCGVRVEDVVLVTSEGYENLTGTPYEIRIP